MVAMTPLDQQFHQFAKELGIQDSTDLEKFRQCFYTGCLVTLIRCEDHMPSKESETVFDTINHEYHTPQKATALDSSRVDAWLRNPASWGLHSQHEIVY